MDSITPPLSPSLLCEGDPGIMQCIVLWGVAHAWGGRECPPVAFRSHPDHYPHALYGCTRDTPAPQVSSSDALLLLRLHQKYGPDVVHLDRVANCVPGLTPGLMREAPCDALVFSMRYPLFFALERVAPRLEVNHNRGARYPPGEIVRDGQRALVDTTVFRHRLCRVTHGALSGMGWDDVFMAGGCATACVSAAPDPPFGDVDLFVMSPDAMDRVLTHFDARYPGQVVVGLNHATVTLCIVGVPCVFQIIPAYEGDAYGTVSRFDLECAQVLYMEGEVWLSARAARALSCRTCTVSPHVLPRRQLKAYRRGWGLDVVGPDVVGDCTFWDVAPGYTPAPGHTPHQIEHNMRVNLGCGLVTRSIEALRDEHTDLDPLSIPTYVPSVSAHGLYTASAFAACAATRLAFRATLPPTPPNDDTESIVLHTTMVVPKHVWVYAAGAGEVKMHGTGGDVVRGVVGRMQAVIDELYGPGVVTCTPMEGMRVNLLPTTRILDMGTRELHSGYSTLNLPRDSLVVLDLVCSYILIDTTAWVPVWTARSVEILPQSNFDGAN